MQPPLTGKDWRVNILSRFLALLDVYFFFFPLGIVPISWYILCTVLIIKGWLQNVSVTERNVTINAKMRPWPWQTHRSSSSRADLTRLMCAKVNMAHHQVLDVSALTGKRVHHWLYVLSLSSNITAVLYSCCHDDSVQVEEVLNCNGTWEVPKPYFI